MKKYFLQMQFCVILVWQVCPSHAQTVTDLSPDRNNDVLDGGTSTAGLVLNMAGDKNGLYGIGLNSGVWKTQINADLSFNKWRQLPQSPRYAHCIAVDPQFPEHIAVGEREGDAANLADNDCGLWESFNGGQTFEPKYHYKQPADACGSHVVNAVAITGKSTTLISTPCGIGRREYFQQTFTFSPFLARQSFTAISTFKDWIVARTKTAIFLSNDDGKSWIKHDIQQSFPGQNFTLDYEGERGGNYSVALIQLPQSGKVFVYVPATRTPNDPNYGSCLLFDNQTQKWNFQIVKQRGLGIGLGGRVFIKSFFSPNTKLQNQVGGNTNLIYCCAQNIFKASTINSDGTAVWENVANADIGGEAKPSGIHADMWDYLIDPLGWFAWVSCDGGVYYVKMNNQQNLIALNIGQKYMNLNAGLHTQHIHSGFVVTAGNGQGTTSYGYGCTDNDAWKNSLMGSANWNVIGGTGDANWVAGDEGNPQFILAARHFQNAMLSTLQGGSPGGGAQVGGININDNVRLNGLQSFHFIQTLVSESSPPFLDAVALTTVPLLRSSAYKTIIVRNTGFALNPDISKSTGWKAEYVDLPSGVEGFWVSGGHANPTYFLLCNNLGVRTLYRRNRTDATWIDMKAPTINGVAEYGPVFVNPYNVSMIYVSCGDGVYRYSVAIGGGFFTKDADLTNLISGNGKYPINRVFSGGDGANVSHATQANDMCPVSCMAFNRYNPNQIVASSPFTGVFFKNGSSAWRDLSGVLPKPFTPISSVNINNQGIYVTTEGRGMLLIQGF